MSVSNRIIIIDAYNLFTRHYVAHPGMSKNGDQVGGIVGFFNNTLRLVERINPERVYVIWEGGGSQRKRDLYKDYKKGRKPIKMNRYYEDIPDSLENRNFQIKTLIALLNKFPVTQIYVEGSEADDAIGYMVKYKLSKQSSIIVSSDHDFYQLIGKNTIVWSPTLKSFVNDKKVIERFGIHPNNFCLAKSISGDSSDNIPGIKGVSFKTLSKYFPKFSKEADYLMDEFFEDVKELKKTKKLKILERLSCIFEENTVRRNWKLVHLDMGNITQHQVKIIDQKIENYDFAMNNIGAHKLLNESGILNIDLLKAKILFKNMK
jgi:DNA polymerase I